jgi:hypothetical protein
MRLVAWACALWVLIAGGTSASAAEIAAPVSTELDHLWVYDPKGRCDPFVALVREGRPVPCDSRPGAAAEAGGPAPVLGGILWDPDGHSIALINGGEMKVGEMVDGFRVTTIRPDEVVLSRDKRQVVLRINFDSQTPEEGQRRKEVQEP